MENFHDIQSQIENKKTEIANLDEKINTDEELLRHFEEIKKIYNDINALDTMINGIEDENKKNILKSSLFKIKTAFADFMYQRFNDVDLSDDKYTGEIDTIIRSFIDELEKIISKNFNQIDIPQDKNESYMNYVNKILNENLTPELIDDINENLSIQSKIELLKELSKNNNITPDEIAFLATGFGFTSGVLVMGENGENGENTIPYINYGTSCIIIDGGDIIDGENDEEAYAKYISENIEIIDDNESDNQIKIKFGKASNVTIYTLATDNLEKKIKLMGDLQKNVDKKNLKVYEFIHKLGIFTKVELNGGKDSVKAELYSRLSTGGSDVKLGGGGLLSYKHKGKNFTSDTSLGVSGNLATFTSSGPQWNPSPVRLDVTEKITLKNWSLGATLGATLSPNGTKISSSVSAGYQHGKTGFTASVGTSGGSIGASVGVTVKF